MQKKNAGPGTKISATVIKEIHVITEQDELIVFRIPKYLEGELSKQQHTCMINLRGEFEEMDYYEQ